MCPQKPLAEPHEGTPDRNPKKNWGIPYCVPQSPKSQKLPEAPPPEAAEATYAVVPFLRKGNGVFPPGETRGGSINS